MIFISRATSRPQCCSTDCFHQHCYSYQPARLNSTKIFCLPPLTAVTHISNSLPTMPDPPSSSNPERKHGFETNSEIPLHTTHDQDAFSLYSVATGDAKESRASSQYSKRRSDIAANTTKDGGIELNAVVRQVSSSTSVDGDPEGSEADINPTDDDETTYPGGLQLFILTLGLCLTTFTVALDNTSKYDQVTQSVRKSLMSLKSLLLPYLGLRLSSILLVTLVGMDRGESQSCI